MSMVVSVQDSSPVNWTSWERRFFPGGVCAEEEFCGSCLGKTFCCGGAVFSRTSCAARAYGQTAATRDSPRMNCIFAMRVESWERAIPRRSREHLYYYRCSGQAQALSRSSNRLAWRRTEDSAETRRPRRVRREEAGFLDGVRWGLVDWQDAVARGHRPRPHM